MRWFYAFLVTLGLPFVAGYWIARAVSDPHYRPKLAQRFGFGYPKLSGAHRRVWVHAVSVGEVQAAANLVRELQSRLPDAQVLITTVTPTGADRVALLFGDTVAHAYVPYDFGWFVGRFYRAVRPDLAVIVETELWPNLYHEAGVRQVPLVLASARISPRSMPRYRRLVGLFREALSNGIIIAAQSEVDRQRFVALGAPEERTFVCGNIKFDFTFDEQLAARGAGLRSIRFPGRPVWVAASTHEGEEEIALDAHARLLEQHPEALLVLVPRHPARFDDVAQLLERRGFAYVRRTADKPLVDEESVLLGDTMGELNLFYAASDVAFVGGSLVPIGGHNLLEPGSLGMPILTGPHLFNAQDIANLFTTRGAVEIVTDAPDLATHLGQLLSDPRAREVMGVRAATLIEENRGAVDLLLGRLLPLIEREDQRRAANASAYQ